VQTFKGWPKNVSGKEKWQALISRKRVVDEEN